MAKKEKAKVNVKSAEKVGINPGESKWDGTLLSMIGIYALSFFVVAAFLAVGAAIMFLLVGDAQEPDPVMMVLGIIALYVCMMIGMCWMVVILLKWDTKHTVISGQRLKFTGNTAGFMLNILKWMFLTIITFGIYGLWMTIKVRQWQIKHTVSYPNVEEDGSFEELKEVEEKKDEDDGMITFQTVVE